MRCRLALRGNVAVLLASLTLAACSRSIEAPARHPNVLWIVWDTVRADHLSLYGYARPTTPFLSEWAKDARVFDDALSVAGYTLPSHASMFTGLYPSEHCTNNDNVRLDDAYTTIAELFKSAGYRTYLFSANPFITADPSGNFAQGFDLTEHPWSPSYAEEALRIVQEKLPPEDRSSELPVKVAAARQGRGRLTESQLKAAGAIAKKATLHWLESSDSGKPFFVFLNYMEAHRPTIPPRRYRERLLSSEDVARSYQVDRSWVRMWEYTFGLRDYSNDEIALTRATYDAALLELDDLLRDLLEGLRATGHLEDTIVVLTADHGEQLGEQHMLDHQYSVYQAVLRVPLVIYAPGRVAPGHETRPVMNFDLFPTLLDLAGIAPPMGPRSHAMSLLAPQSDRVRFAEEPATPKTGIEQVARVHPGWDAIGFQRRLRTLIEGTQKLVWGSDGRQEMYDLATDPYETRNQIDAQPEIAAKLGADLDRYFATFTRCQMPSRPVDRRQTPPEQQDLLKGLGYLEDDVRDARKP